MFEYLNKIKPLLIVSFLPFFAMLLVAVFHENGILTVNQHEEQLRRLQVANERLRQDNIKLRQEVDELRSDPFAIEKIAREKLNLARPGEMIFQVIPKPEAVPPAP
jgi:cell division protein FtsB